MSLLTTAVKVLTKAAELVGGDRAEAHGDMWETHDNIARLWNGYLHNVKSLTAHDAANMLELLKIARRKNGERNEDDYVDGAGYAGVAWQCAVHEDLRRGSRAKLARELEPGLNALFGELKPGEEHEKES